MHERVRTYLLSSHVSLAGLLYGIDTGCVGPMTTMPQFEAEFPLTASTKGLFIAIFLVAAAVASLVNGVISDRISRRWTISLGAATCLMGCIVSFFSHSVPQIFVGRIVYGIGNGLAFSCCLTYIMEISSGHLRGQVSSLLQFLSTIGTMSGYFITYGSVQISGSLSWRLPFILQAFVAIWLIAGNFFIPYSPRWLLSKGREEEAIVVMNYLRDDPIGRNAPREVERMQEEITAIKAGILAEETGEASSYKDVFSRDLRSRMLLTIFLCVIQQAGGIDAVLYFSPTIFKSAGLVSLSSSFLASAMSGVTIVVFTIPGFFVDKIGRRQPSIFGGAVMTCAMLIIGTCFAVKGYRGADGAIGLHGRAAQWTVIVLIYVFVAAFAASWALVIRIWCCEIIPTRQRSRASALQQYANWTANFVIAISAPSFLKASASAPYFFYSSCCAAGTIVSVMYVKETKGQSLESMNELFNRSGRDAETDRATTTGLELDSMTHKNRRNVTQTEVENQ